MLASAIALYPIAVHASPRAPQACTIAGGGVGQSSSVVCKDIATGDTTQTIAVAPVVAAAGGVGGNLVRHHDSVLVTNQQGGAALFEEHAGRLIASTTLHTGEDSLSGFLTDHGAYVVTPTRLLFFRTGAQTPTSAQPLLAADGSAAQVVVSNGYAYVSEKSRSLEAFRLGAGGELVGAATAVSGIPAGVIVGIANVHHLVVAPIAHLASNAAQAAISVVGRTAQLQLVATKEVAACWTKSEGDAVCVTNPGSMTVSCGHAGDDALASYTNIATATTGAAGFDLDLRDDLVAIQATADGHPLLLIYSRDDERSDFLSEVTRVSVATAAATGALLLPPIGNH